MYAQVQVHSFIESIIIVISIVNIFKRQSTTSTKSETGLFLNQASHRCCLCCCCWLDREWSKVCPSLFINSELNRQWLFPPIRSFVVYLFFSPTQLNSNSVSLILSVVCLRNEIKYYNSTPLNRVGVPMSTLNLVPRIQLMCNFWKCRKQTMKNLVWEFCCCYFFPFFHSFSLSISWKKKKYFFNCLYCSTNI